MLGLEMLPQLALQATNAEKALIGVSVTYYYFSIIVTVCFILAVVAAISLWLKLRKLDGGAEPKEEEQPEQTME
jgi:cytochrome bd-type quinol oxidase subunit 1